MESHVCNASPKHIPKELADLIDAIASGLDKTERADWREQAMAAIPIGADLSRIWPRFAVWLLIGRRTGLFYLAEFTAAEKPISEIATLYQWLADGEEQAELQIALTAAYKAANAVSLHLAAISQMAASAAQAAGYAAIGDLPAAIEGAAYAVGEKAGADPIQASLRERRNIAAERRAMHYREMSKRLLSLLKEVK